jgi:hypothetical protein
MDREVEAAEKDVAASKDEDARYQAEDVLERLRSLRDVLKAA